MEPDFDEVRRKLSMRSGVSLGRVPRKVVDVIGSITVSKGNITYPQFSLVAVDGQSIILHHSKEEMPNAKDWHLEWDFGTGRNYAWVKVRYREHTAIIKEALLRWEVYKNSSLNGYTWLIAYCLASGLDLLKEGYIGK